MTTFTETTDAVASSVTPYTLNIGDSFLGNLSVAGDQDWVKVVVAAGQSINVVMTGTSGALTTGANCYVNIVDSTGAIIAAEQGSSTNTSSTSYTNTTGSAQTLYISAADYGNTDTGGYTLAVTAPAPVSILDSLDWGGSKLASTNVTVYFAAASEVFDGVTSLGWTQTQIDNVMLALSDMSKGTPLNFTVTTNAAAATFKMVTENNPGQSYSAYMNPPSEANPGVGVFNTANMDLNNLIKGSLDYFIIQHESGHALGLAHPHDTGGGSLIMNGVSSSGDLGDYNLNQGINTIMSYNPGYYDLYGYPTGTFGATVGPMALDLALLQQKYGTAAANTGANTYTLPGTNTTGTYFQLIWDTGGTDQIVYSGALAVNISLIAATLDYSATGGGGVSYASGIKGGYTIANGVVIENASGGSGNDIIKGNSASNILTGNAGNDTLEGGAGGDTLNGGAGFDTAVYSSSWEGVWLFLGGGTAHGGHANGDTLIGIENAYGSSFNDTIYGSAQSNFLSGGNGDDYLSGQDGSDRLLGGVGRDVLFGGNGADNFEYWSVSESGTTFATRDYIRDYQDGVDRFNVSVIDANTIAAGNQAFNFIGAGAFTNVAGQMRAFQFNGDTFIQGDVNGDGVADFMLHVAGLHTIDASDFLL